MRETCATWMPRPGAAIVFRFAWLLAALGLTFGTVAAAQANEVGSPWGYSKTYQNNYYSYCHWYDSFHDTMSDHSCYRGVWSNTQVYGPGMSEVREFASRQTYGAVGNAVKVYYAFFGAYPSDVTGTGLVTTDHYCGDQSCLWPVNVIGFAYHYGPGPNDLSYTEAQWGSQYVY